MILQPYSCSLALFLVKMIFLTHTKNEHLKLNVKYLCDLKREFHKTDIIASKKLTIINSNIIIGEFKFN